MNKPADRSEHTASADVNNKQNANADDVNELSKDDLSGVTGGTDPIKAIIAPYIDQN
jgi:hypothetical protein